MSVQRNFYGNILVNFNQNDQNIPKELLDNSKTDTNFLCVLGWQNTTMPPSIAPFLLHTFSYNGSHLYGNAFAFQNFPRVDQRYLYSACVCLFLESSKGDLYLVVVQGKDKKYSMQPAGYVQRDETLETAAKRETFEETGIEIKQNLKKLAHWTHPSKFACMDWVTFMQCFYVVEKMSIKWETKLAKEGGKILTIDGSEVPDHKEIQEVYLIPIREILSAEHSIQTGNTNFQTHHLHSAKIAASLLRKPKFDHLQSYELDLT
jgi:8-oxo-dGTP pyrophosphatase MutT (NUDIX family)